MSFQPVSTSSIVKTRKKKCQNLSKLVQLQKSSRVSHSQHTKLRHMSMVKMVSIYALESLMGSQTSLPCWTVVVNAASYNLIRVIRSTIPSTSSPSMAQKFRAMVKNKSTSELVGKLTRCQRSKQTSRNP